MKTMEEYKTIIKKNLGHTQTHGGHTANDLINL